MSYGADKPIKDRPNQAVQRAGGAQPQLAGSLAQAGRWTQGRLQALGRFRFKRPSHRALAWTAGVLGALILAVVLFLYWFDWDRARGPIAHFASGRIHREVAIDGHLRVHLLTWSPTATVGSLRVRQPDWAGKGDMIAMDSATVSIRLPSLLRGQVLLPLVSLERPRFDLIRAADGRANWQFSPTTSNKPARLPPIQKFVIDDGSIRYVDVKKRLTVTGAIEARERRSGPYDQGFHLDGRGATNGNPFLLKVVGGPLINIDRNRPYPFNADIRAGSSRVIANGSITRPFDFGHFRASLKLSGPDLADFYYLTGLTLPNTPPYNLSGDLSRDGTLFRITRIAGKVGDSDLEGELSVETRTKRPNLTADLRSRVLDFDDLNALLGGAPGRRGTISPQQAAVARRMAASQRLLPDAPLQVERLRAMDASVRYRAQSVRSDKLPVRKASVDVKLKDGVLALNPFTFTLTRGQVTGSARIDGRKAIPVTDFDARLRGVGIEQFLPARGGAPAIEGAIEARARLHGTGASVHRAAANADGDITLVVPRGQIRQSFAELLGINAGKGLYLLLSKDNRQTDLRCAVADFKVSNGVAQARNLVVDTGVVVAHGQGTINLDSERMDLVIEGKTKKPRLLHVWAPITLQGPLSAPRPGIQAGRAIAQAGLGVALGAVLTPLAAILPFVDPGLAKDADCAGLIAQAATGPAPVKAAAR